MASSAVKGKKSGTPNYRNDMLLNVIEAILPAGSEQWKTVASRYQIISGESTIRNHDDIRRHYMAKLCKNCKRQTGLNNKSAPTAIVARAQEIQRKILTNEATMNFGGDNENEEEEDNDDDDNDEDDDEDCLNGEIVAVATPSDENAAPSNVPVKKKIKLEYEDQKTKNSRPVNSNPRGGTLAAVKDICSGLKEERASNQMSEFQKQLREQQDRADARLERMQMQMQMQMQNQQNQMMQMMMMMMQGQMKGDGARPHADTPQWNGRVPSFLTARSSANSNFNDFTNDDDANL